MRSNVRYRPVMAIAGVFALGACEFSDSIEIGQHDVGGSGARPAPVAGGGGGGRGGAFATPGGTSGVGGSAGLAASGARNSTCDVSLQHLPTWVVPTESPTRLAPGVGGVLKAGEYRLVGLVKHGVCPCFDADATLAQTLFLSDEGIGSVLSVFRDKTLQFTSKFTFSSQGNTFNLNSTCVAPAGPPHVPAPFGGFETFTAQGDVLSLISQACSYRLDYRYVPRVPSR